LDKVIQGEAIRRSGCIEVMVKIEAGVPVEVKIAGSAVIAFQSELSI
jgi:predicted PhzF superfamily epimerase YddE/YHI9